MKDDSNVQFIAVTTFLAQNRAYARGFKVVNAKVVS